MHALTLLFECLLDIIVNPHAIPSRMTVGHLIECVLGKACALNGKYGDGTPFNKVSVESIGDALEQCGYQRYGNETLYSGITGLPLKGAKVFIGPTYYQILKHMVQDKVYSRNTGKVDRRNRQPPEGRKRQGGLRFGEMERDCAVAHGVSAFLKDRMFEESDYFTCPVCKTCGNIAIPRNSKTYGDSVYQHARCQLCKTSEVVETEIPYSQKRFIQMMQAVHVKLKLNVVPKNMK